MRCSSDLCRQGRNQCPTPIACRLPADDGALEDWIDEMLRLDPFAGAGLAAAVCLTLAFVVIFIDRGPWLLAWLWFGQ